MAVDQEKIKEHVRGILEAIGEGPDREGLIETPDRVARMYSEIFEGISYTNDEIVAMFNKTFEAPATGDMVLVKDIEIFSYCEHHMALMYDMKVAVAYIPRERVIGLSKIARIAEMVGKRLQLQERIGTDIAYIMEKATKSPDVAVIITGKHSCMTARGIKNSPSSTLTTTFRGAFREDRNLQDRVMRLLEMKTEHVIDTRYF
jgi:GTP cyclohydrolase I